MVDNLTIANWETYQHYKDRSPSWIKLHIDILNSETWVMLDDASKLLAVVTMMIGSRNKGKVPNNPSYIKKVAHLDEVPNFKPLIDVGFLIDDSTKQADASSMQADASSKKRRGEDIEEKRREEKKSAPEQEVLPEWLPMQDWKDFVEMRKKKNKGLNMTARQVSLILGKLESFRTLKQDPALVLQQAIERGWTSIFELKEDYKKTKSERPNMRKSETTRTHNDQDINKKFGIIEK